MQFLFANTDFFFFLQSDMKKFLFNDRKCENKKENNDVVEEFKKFFLFSVFLSITHGKCSYSR